jgi:hypothetical protein
MSKKALEKIRTGDQLDSINRKLEELVGRVDTLDSHMDVIDTLIGRISSLEEQMILTKKHDKQAKKDIQTDISMAEIKTGAKVDSGIDEIKDMIEKKKIVHIKHKGFFARLFDKRW